MWRRLLSYFFVFSMFSATYGFSDVGKWDLPLSGESCKFALAKSLYKGSKLIVRLHCDVINPTNITIAYQWIPIKCSPDYYHFFEQEVVLCSNRATRSLDDLTNFTSAIERKQTQTCHNKNTIFFTEISTSNKVENVISSNNDIAQSKSPPLLIVDMEGVYTFTMSLNSPTKFNGSIRVEMVSPHGYLSAAIWPLLPFFGVMCAVYTILCTCWLLVCGINWRDLLRIQYWIGGVALLGMLETSTYYGVYSSINNSGYFNTQAYMFAEFMSVAKRALARMLVIIVSLGFGIVKPRLGPALQRVVGTGLLWGLLAAIEAWLRLHHKEKDSNKDILLAEAPLSMLDSAISWWVFVSLAHTMRTLQLRRNAIKLSLYRHFTNTLIFAVIASVIFMLYSIKTYRVIPCIVDWKHVWLDEAYWHMLFVTVLAVIMILWRPTNNNQRYAFTPLLDNAEDDDDEEEQFVNDAYGVKMRGTSISGGGGDAAGAESAKEQHERSNSLDSDLRWVEENIPTSTLPLLDSDEEIINTKFEVSKMQ